MGVLPASESVSLLLLNATEAEPAVPVASPEFPPRCPDPPADMGTAARRSADAGRLFLVGSMSF